MMGVWISLVSKYTTIASFDISFVTEPEVTENKSEREAENLTPGSQHCPSAGGTLISHCQSIPECSVAQPLSLNVPSAIHVPYLFLIMVPQE